MRLNRHLLLLGLLAIQPVSALSQEPYFPPKGLWTRKAPADLGLNAEGISKAIAFAKEHESSHPKDFSNQEAVFGKALGPLPKERSATKGVVVYKGYIVAEWGDVDAVEPTYSAAKSFLSTIAGVALERKLLASVDEPVGQRIKDGGYASEHNAKVTWKMHLTQASEWQGELWGKNANFLGQEEFGQGQMRPRDPKEPGAYYEYNDVRINRLALSLLRLFHKPLPDVLREAILDPIGASDRWQYHGYRNSYVTVGGRSIQSVTGGTRWGGGLWISALDQARFGLLFGRQGAWNGKQIVSKDWVRQATSPSATKSDYGYLWWLNPGRRAWPALSEKAFAAVGFGSNTIWIDPEKDLVVVWRWHDNRANDFLKMIVDALPASG